MNERIYEETDLTPSVELRTRSCELADETVYLKAKGINALADLMQADNVTVKEIQQIAAGRGYYSEVTPIDAYDKKFVDSVLISAWPQVYKSILQARTAKTVDQIMKYMEHIKVYCPDCDEELQPCVHQQRIEPFKTYLYFYCQGTCDPEQGHNGAPKIYIEFDNKRKTNLNEAISTAVDHMGCLYGIRAENKKNRLEKEA